MNQFGQWARRNILVVFLTVILFDEHPVIVTAQSQSGLLTAGNIDDNLNFRPYRAYIERTAAQLSNDKQDQQQSQTPSYLPRPVLDDRVSVQVNDENGDPFSCAMVRMKNSDDKIIELPAATNGRLWVFPTLDGLSDGDGGANPETWEISARAPEGSCPDDCSDTSISSNETTPMVNLTISQPSLLPTKLDLALIVDTTGSMCDELTFLQTEITSVIETVLSRTQTAVGQRHRVLQGSSVDVRLALVVYRDKGDAYVVKTTPFGTVEDVASTFKTETCGGGGDFPEAMDQAMEAAATELVWRTGNVARVALVVADAPPHNEHLRDALESALKMRRLGVRLYGLAASGVAQTAEYLMRLTALVTGARYAWLTDDSGIGDSHAEPSVVCYKVTRLDSLLVRILQGELLGRRIEAEEGVIREVGSQVKGVCIVDV
eukprot:CAMPEP_0194393150 /NCGR_PEP_ID=MMETSP0174-20130528/123138_1 /TAXON_ID=216777 /ORGANISM="Proboscia alata, Strain PI-D3" /LENGTH=431 /DNA_ID=CAMNT_0039188803 /DNA_START=101 /DNA_END=1392 /DNA_ORIENTATION=+